MKISEIKEENTKRQNLLGLEVLGWEALPLTMYHLSRMKVDGLPGDSRDFGPPSFWNSFQLREREICPEDSKKGLFSENDVLYFRAKNMYPLKVSQGPGDYIKNRERQMMGEQFRQSAHTFRIMWVSNFRRGKQGTQQ